MRAELSLRLCGGEHSLALPMGALEDIAEKIEPEVYMLMSRLATGKWKLSEVCGVLDTALKAGGSDITAEDIVHKEGLMRGAEVAFEILERALSGPPPKKTVAVAKKKKPKPDS